MGRARSGAGPFGGVDASLGQQRSRAGHQPRHLGVDQFVEHRPPEFAPGELAVAGPHALGGLGDQRELQQFLQRHQAQFHGVVGVVGVVGDRVGGIDHLRFQQRGRRPAVAAAGGLAIEHLARKVQPRKAGVAGFEQLHDPQRLGVVGEAPRVGQQFVERVLARMAQRWMADIVGQRQGLHQILIEPQRPGERAGDVGHLQRVRETAAVVIAMVAGEDLRLVGQPAEGG